MCGKKDAWARLADGKARRMLVLLLLLLLAVLAERSWKQYAT